MSNIQFTRETPLAEILKHNPGLISVFDEWCLHLVPSTVVAMNAPLEKAAHWHAIFDTDKLLAELNAKKDLDFHTAQPEHAPEPEPDPELPGFKYNGSPKKPGRRVWE
ncbi:hypothetical protein HZB60_12905 [candidate division KSB1 bacterium]|nr:hypothetical protein [candidate division KSB1 bacterium]